MQDYIAVTDWEKVDKDDFYLSKYWEKKAGKGNIKQARKLQKEGNLFYAYIVPAVHYAIYTRMDAQGILIDSDGNEIVSCESAVIGNKHQEKWEVKF